MKSILLYWHKTDLTPLPSTLDLDLGSGLDFVD